MAMSRADDRAITLGHPSYVWRAGQERRLEMIRAHVRLEGARILDVGCGLGMFVRRFRQFGDDVHGVDVEPERVAEASRSLPNIRVAGAEELPYADRTFDMVLLHEVLEHVRDDGAALREACRVTRSGGRVVVFVPNRWYPFETHGVFWRRRYRFGNIPLVNYLPDALRNHLCPHVRTYTGRQLRSLFQGLPGKVVAHRRIYAGYDNIVARAPRLGRLLCRMSYLAERTPLQVLGLSHLLVFEVTRGQERLQVLRGDAGGAIGA
jgi:SAM-dependent methyltransferase